MNNASIVWVIILGAIIGVYVLYRQGKIPWLKGIKLPRMFEPKADTLTEQLKAQTEKEKARAEELRKVLEAKKGLAKARAENIRLKKEIDGVSEKSVEKEEQEAKEKATKTRRV